MDAVAPPGETNKRTLTTDDVTGICSVYPPGTLPDSCDPTPRGGQNLACTPAGNCGCTAPGHPTHSGAPAALILIAGLAAVPRRRRH